MKDLVKDLTVDDLREMIEQTVRGTLRSTIEEYMEDLRLLLAPLTGPPVEVPNDPRPLADRPLKRSMDH